MEDLYLNRLISIALTWELLSLLNGSESSADPVCPLQLSADRMVIKYEDPVSVLCSTTTSAETLYWTVDSQKINNNTWSVNRLLKWDISPYCNATFPGIGSCRKPLHITVYKTPDNMSISLLNHSGPMVEGTEYRLQCDIQNVAPLQNLVVKWYKGNEFLLNVTYSNSTKTPVDVSPTLIITPSRDDDGAQYRCEAELVLGPEGPQPPPTVSSKYQIYVEIRPQHQPTPGSRNIVQPTAKPKGHNDLLELNPPSVVVKYGDPVSVNCSTSCTDCEGMGWEVTQGGTAFQLNATIVTWIVDNLEDWTIKPMCYITTSTNQVTKTLPVILYKTPDNMSISLLDHSGPMVEGTEYHLQCDIQNVAPVQNLTVKWYKGNESLLNVPCSNSTKTPVDLSPTLTITPSSDDDGAHYRCEAELDLGPEGPQPPPTVSSEPLIITVHFPEPMTVTLNPPKVYNLFVNHQAVLECVINGKNTNAVRNARIAWNVNKQSRRDGISEVVKNDQQTPRKVSTLTLNRRDWGTVNTVQCSAESNGITTGNQELVINHGCKGYSVSAHILSEESMNDKGVVTLVCLVVSPSLCDFYILWKEGSTPQDEQNSEVVTNPPQKTHSGSYTITSIFTTSKGKWDNNVKFSCSVTHAGLDTGTGPREISVSKPLVPEPMTVTLNPPKVYNLFVNHQAVLEGVINGKNTNAVRNARIAWNVNKQSRRDGIS